MYLSPTEEDRLRIFVAAELARRTRADGVKLNAPETTALICDEMHRAARAGGSLQAVLAAGRAAVDADDVIDGVPALVEEIRIEVLLEDGTRLVVLRDPLGQDAGSQPGEIRVPTGDLELGPGRSRRRIRVTSMSSRPIRVSSHYPFWRVNPRLEFDRSAAEGYRLDIPAGASIRWAPGEAREVDLVALGAGTPVSAPRPTHSEEGQHAPR
jgi:urease subunit gamma/beta